MDKIIERDYDPQTVSNKFAVGECIELIDSYWQDGQERMHVRLRRSTILHIRPRVVILANELPNGEIGHLRIERFYLTEWVHDPELRKAIDTWEGSSDQTRKREKSTQTRSDEPHAIYKLSDPRDHAVRYVGLTKNKEARFKAHLEMHDFNFKKHAWLQELAALGLRPLYDIIEDNIPGVVMARERETYWMQYYLSQGASLTNLAKMRNSEGRYSW